MAWAGGIGSRVPASHPSTIRERAVALLSQPFEVNVHTSVVPGIVPTHERPSGGTLSQEVHAETDPDQQGAAMPHDVSTPHVTDHTRAQSQEYAAPRAQRSALAPPSGAGGA